MIYCNRCVIPDTRPNTIFKDGVCQACTNYDKRKEIDWESRLDELRDLLNEHRGMDKYDCVIPVSGGKDSHYLVYTLKNIFRMNPLLIKVDDGFTMTEEGRYNLSNLSSVFNCDLMEFSVNKTTLKEMARAAFAELGNFPYVDYFIYSIPLRLASQLGIKLVVFGENPSYEYGTTDEDSPLININELMGSQGHFWTSRNFDEMLRPLDSMKIDKDIKAVYMSYYMPWSGHQNYILAQKCGFKELSWNRQGHIENYDSIDSLGWLVSNHLKYLKFGFGRATDIACRWIREGLISREKAVELVNQADEILDNRILKDFLQVTGYKYDEFWGISLRFINQDIFSKGLVKKYPLV
jgi:N-acetyl sugar amidotransferase